MAGFSSTALDTGLTAQGAAATYISLHSGDPGVTGANEISGGSPAYARVATTWGTAASGAMTGSQVTINVPATVTVTYAGLWTAATGGTFYAGCQLPAPQAFP